MEAGWSAACAARRLGFPRPARKQCPLLVLIPDHVPWRCKFAAVQLCKQAVDTCGHAPRLRPTSCRPRSFPHAMSPTDQLPTARAPPQAPDAKPSCSATLPCRRGTRHAVAAAHPLRAPRAALLRRGALLRHRDHLLPAGRHRGQPGRRRRGGALRGPPAAAAPVPARLARRAPVLRPAPGCLSVRAGPVQAWSEWHA